MPITRSTTGEAAADEKIKVSANDTTPNFLKQKLVAGINITLTKLNGGDDETFEIKATGGAALDEQVVFFVQLFS